ncbi:Ribosomal-protein-alanine acetyltransferase [Mycena kentingensis (nom. inval.)]|nr:Ribosomal-protein-alanine acetyltransferase [Mycena kentingensis (nom. inval.)]
MILDAPLVSKSGRILLVPPTEDDDANVAALRTNSTTRTYLRFLPATFTTVQQAARRVERGSDTTLVDFHIHTSDGAFVGTLVYFNIDMKRNAGISCEIGVLVDYERTRTGLGTEALYTLMEHIFEVKGFHRAEFQTRRDNIAMRGWLERAGVVLEGTRREFWQDPESGEYSDLCIYGVLAREWEETVKGKLEARIGV